MSSSFTSELKVTLLDGRNWEISRPFTYHIGSKHSRKYISVPKGFITDFASIPWWLWRFLFFWLPLWAKYCKGAVLHDYLYRIKKIMGKPITRKEADRIFLEANKVAWRHYKSRYFIAYSEYYAVRLFAWLAWKRK